MITGFWSQVAPGYEAHAGNVPARGSPELDAWTRAVTALLPAPPADVLDVATGTGFVAMIAAAAGHRVCGIDLAEPMLALARTEADSRGLRVSFDQGDAVAPAFAPSSFDALISRHLVWTLREPAAALTAWRRLVRPGGRVVAIDGFWFEPETSDDDPPSGLFESFYDRRTREGLPGWRYFDTDAIMELFAQAGLTDLSVTLLSEVHRTALRPAADQPPYAIIGRVRP
jgi:ubiquinone/menaquinone biosynthesis C-methylase UbiE